MRYRSLSIAGLMVGLAGCAEIIGIEPWDVGTGSSSSDGSTSSSTTSGMMTSTSSVGGGGAASTSSSTGSMTSGTGGAPPVTVDCGSASDPVMIEIPSTGDVLCWYLPDIKHPGGTTLAIGGTIDQPTKPDITKSPFDDVATGMSCVATATTDKVVACALGDLEAGTVLTLSPFTEGVHYDMCDDVSLPSPRCYGMFHHFHNGGQEMSFDTEAPSPAAPWSYLNPGSGLQKVVYSGP